MDLSGCVQVLAQAAQLSPGTPAVEEDCRHHYMERLCFRKHFSSVSPNGQEMIVALLRYNPAERLCATAALHHQFMTEEPVACTPETIILCSESRRELEVKEGVPLPGARKRQRSSA